VPSLAAPEAESACIRWDMIDMYTCIHVPLSMYIYIYTFTVSAGSVCALVGRSGGGK